MRKSSDSLKELLAALVNLQAGDPRPKNTEKARLRQYSYDYSPLSEIIAEVRPLMKDNGLGFSQEAELVDEGRCIAVTTTLFHRSGEWLELAPMKIPVDYGNKSVNAAQAAGIAITYGRRYALTAALGISSEDDTDGRVPVRAGGEAGDGRAERRYGGCEEGDDRGYPGHEGRTGSAETGEKETQAGRSSVGNNRHSGETLSEAEGDSGEFTVKMLRVKRLSELEQMAKRNSHELSQDDYNFLGQEIRGLKRESIEDLTEDEYQGVLTLLTQKIRRDKTVLLKGAR